MLFLLSVSGIFAHPFIDTIKHYEGYYSTPYYCPAGKKTIGYGHVILSGEQYSCLSRYQADLLLVKDLAEHIFYLQEDAPTLFDDGDDEQNLNRVLAVTSFIFNLGRGNFRSSTLRKKILAKDWEGAADEFVRWNKCTVNGKKVVLAGLTKRRKAETDMFRDGTLKVY